MKKLYLLFAFLLFASFSKATKHAISVLSATFSPAAVSAVCNDTIIWTLANLTQTHTTTSVSVPAGAAGWGANLSSAATTYSLVLTVPGTYSYVCTFHVTMGMAGSITVTCPSGVAPISNYYISSAYPVPFSSNLTIEFTEADLITIYNAVGDKIRTITLQHGQTKTEINSAELRNGIYFYCIVKEGVVVETRKIVKN